MKNLIFSLYLHYQYFKQIVKYEFNRFKINEHIVKLEACSIVKYNKKLYTIDFISRGSYRVNYRTDTVYGRCVWLQPNNSERKIYISGLEILNIKPQIFNKTPLYKSLNREND